MVENAGSQTNILFQLGIGMPLQSTLWGRVATRPGYVCGLSCLCHRLDPISHLSGISMPEPVDRENGREVTVDVRASSPIRSSRGY
jgi:hypothetical protein